MAELSEEQKKKLEEYKNKWVDIAFGDKRAERETVEKHLKSIYEVNGLPSPQKYVWFDSPFAAAEEIRRLTKSNTVPRENILYGTMDAYWLGLHDFALHELVPDLLKDDPENTELLEYQRVNTPYVRAAEARMGWVWTYDDRAFCCEPHKSVSFDDQDNLHGERKLAIEFYGGDGQAFWHGLPVPNEWVLDPEGTDPATVLQYQDADVRTAGCEIIGWGPILSKLGGKVLDKHPDPEIGELVEVMLPDSDGPSKFLKALDPSKGQDVATPVPEEIQTAKAAQAWIYNLPENLIDAKVIRT